MISPIDHMECQRYVEQVKHEGQEGYLDNICNIYSTMDGYINLTTDGNLSWEISTFCT